MADAAAEPAPAPEEEKPSEEEQEDPALKEKFDVVVLGTGARQAGSTAHMRAQLRPGGVRGRGWADVSAVGTARDLGGSLGNGAVAAVVASAPHIQRSGSLIAAEPIPLCCPQA